MSPTPKSKSKDKKAGKEPSKASSKSLIHVSAGVGVSASGYNPLLGTFHSIETTPLSSPPQVNGRFRNIDDTESHNNNNGNNNNSLSTEYDSVSNNGSWSGESEDHKDKVLNQPVRQEMVVPGGDNDKREKIRQKNEKKHQRQKEKRAQELHERCSGYLMSRKLEALAQQLVAMGFPQEKATMALISNEGRVEQSVVWLLEGGEEDVAGAGASNKHSEPHSDNGSNLKIDISEELARMAEVEIRCKCSRQDVERAIVASEGDLDKAEESLRAPKPEEYGSGGGSITPATGKLPVTSTQNSTRMPQKPSATIIQQPRNDRDFNYTKFDSVSKNLPTMEKVQPKLEWAKPPPSQQSSSIIIPPEKRWPATAASASSVAAAAPVPAAKLEARFVGVGGDESKNPHSMGSVREPVILMQRPQSTTINGKTNPIMSWYPYNNGETLKSSNGFIPAVSGIRNINPNELYNQFSSQPFVSSSASMESLGTSRNSSSNSYGFWNRTNASSSPTIAAASSLGLFSGFGVNVTSGLDWNSGSSMAHLDYSNIDWSLERGGGDGGGGSFMTRPGGGGGGMWGGGGGGGMKSLSSSSSSSMKRVLSNGSNVQMVQDGGVDSSDTSSASSSREWTSPFEERDLFSLPRQFVSSPSL